MAASDVEFRCFVGGLAWATDDRSLERAFSEFGEVIESKVINDRETGRSKGFGFVTFSNEQDLDGRSITVNQAQSRGSGGFRSGGGGGGGGGYGGGYGGQRREGGGYSREGGGGGGYSRGGGRDRGYGGGSDRFSRGQDGGSDGYWRN
ncbi:unnamed protein product [Spirodela intermedia]|uniref:RRM domain-containing protein n=1 Tax=Spirodela intermedia TaxID=51605 RepID=A0A7I8IIB8_SPIIN|nr:unnamed protein product [Spirodela intermedia]CAA6657615.1 unnamed protein product [Spirodela intermedia]